MGPACLVSCWSMAVARNYNVIRRERNMKDLCGYGTIEKTKIHILEFWCMAIIIAITWCCSCVRLEHLSVLFIISLAAFLYLIIFDSKLDYSSSPIFLCFVILAGMSLIGYFNNFAALERDSLYSSRLRDLEYIAWLPSSIKNSIYTGNSICVFMRWSAYAMITSVFFAAMRHASSRVLLLTFFSVNAALMGLLAIFQLKFGTNCVYGMFYSKSAVYGTFFLENAAGTFLGMGLVSCLFIFSKSDSVAYRIFCVLLIFLICAAMFFNNSNGSKIQIFVILMVGALAYLSRIDCPFGIKAIIAAIAAAIFVAVAILLLSNMYYYGNSLLEISKQSILTRIGIYDVSLNVFLKNPVYGVGEESFSAMASPYYLSRMSENGVNTIVGLRKSHSDFLDILAGYGIVGAAVVLFSIGYFYKRLFAATKNTSGKIIYWGSLVGLLIGSFDICVSIPSVAAAWIILVSAAYSERRDLEPSTEKNASHRHAIARLCSGVAACVFIFGGYCAWAEYSSSMDPDEKSIRFEILKSAAEFGDVGEVERQGERLRNSEYSRDVEKLRALASGKNSSCSLEERVAFDLAREIKSNFRLDFLRDNMGFVYFMKPGEAKARIIAELLKQSDVPEHVCRKLVNIAKLELSSNKYKYQPYFESMAKSLIDRGDADSAAFFIDLISAGIANKTLALYSICGSPAAGKIINKIGNYDFKTMDYALKRVLGYVPLITRLSRKENYAEIIKQLRYTGYQYGLAFYIPSQISCLPIYTYIFSRIGNDRLHSKYKEEMLSWITLKKASGNYIAYCEVACKVLAADNDCDSIIALLDTLNTRSQKMQVLKYSIFDLISNRDSLKKISDYLERGA